MPKKKAKTKYVPPKAEVKLIDPTFANTFLDRIERLAQESHNRTATVTFYSKQRNWSERIDVFYKEGNTFEWAYEPFYRNLIAARLINPETYPIAVVVRTFTDKEFATPSEDILLPGKQIRMYLLAKYGVFKQLTSEECVACFNADSETGDTLPFDPTITFLGS